MKNLSASYIMLNRMKWSEMFDSEEELIETLKSIDVDNYIKNHYKGYEYVRTFQNTLNSGRDLSPKQITQLKRICKEIYSYVKGF